MEDPQYILAATPVDRVKFNHFFEAGENSIRSLLEKPGELRFAGWDLQTLDQARIVRGEALEVSNGERKVIRVYEDGTLILRAAINETFLAWGKSREQFLKLPRIHSMALIEITYNFVHFYNKLIPLFSQKPSKIRFIIELKNLFLNEKKVYMTPDGLRAFPKEMDRDAKEAQQENIRQETTVDTTEVEGSVPHTAYKLVEPVYRWFGFYPEQIPFHNQDSKGRFIEFDQIKEARSPFPIFTD